MRKRFVPFATAESIYAIDPSFFHNLGVKVILSDLDNTLATVKDKDPTPEAFALAKRLEGEGIRLVIVSNNSGKRVSRFAKALGVEYACWMRKPFGGPLKRYLKKIGIRQDEAILIGDQVITDVAAGNAAGIRTILTEPLNREKDPIWTRFNRIFDNPKRKKIEKEKLAESWERKI